MNLTSIVMMLTGVAIAVFNLYWIAKLIRKDGRAQWRNDFSDATKKAVFLAATFIFTGTVILLTNVLGSASGVPLVRLTFQVVGATSILVGMVMLYLTSMQVSQRK